MKTGKIIGCLSLFVCSMNVNAAFILTVDGSLDTLSTWGTTANETGIQHYTDTYGVYEGANVHFEIFVDFSRQGEITNEDGSVSVYQDVPITSNCDGCYGSSGYKYDYASLISSSIDFSILPASETYNVATSNYSTGMATDYHWGRIELANVLNLQKSTGDIESFVYHWREGDYLDLNITLDDGNGVVNYYGSVNISSLEEVPVPAAAWLFGSALLGLAAAKRREFSK